MRVVYTEEETGQTKRLGGVFEVSYVNGQFRIVYEDGDDFWMTPEEFEKVIPGPSSSGAAVDLGFGGGF